VNGVVEAEVPFFLSVGAGAAPRFENAKTVRVRAHGESFYRVRTVDRNDGEKTPRAFGG